MTKHYLLVSDFDQTLSSHDSGLVLSQLLGVPDFEARAQGLSRINFVQQGAELAYLVLHDPEFRRVRREHLIETGKRIRLKRNIDFLARFVERSIDGHRFHFFVVSAAPEEVIKSALEGLVPPDRIFGARFNYHAATGEIESIARIPAGYGKVAVLMDLQARLRIASDRVVYVGDGSSDVHVMLHVNRRDGFTIAVSENKYITPIAKRTVLSDDTLSVLVPILEDILQWDATRVRVHFETHGFLIQEWDKVRTDWLTIRDSSPDVASEGAHV
ncbi:MAG: HAD-IB family phosphatase [Luteitalea sp.]|nr:HAD-IB family phosphatase [Luteitalea sp.]